MHFQLKEIIFFVSLLFVNYLIGQELFIEGGGTLNDWANLSRYKEENIYSK